MPIIPKYVNVNLNGSMPIDHLNYTLNKYEEELYQNQQQIKNMQEYIDTLHSNLNDNLIVPFNSQFDLSIMDTNSLLDLRRKIDKELSGREIEQI